jgi:hypothetical protein
MVSLAKVIKRVTFGNLTKIIIQALLTTNGLIGETLLLSSFVYGESF